MMAFLGPRVGKEDPNFGKRDAFRQTFDQLAGFGADEMAVGKFGAVGLALGAFHAFAAQIHAQTEFLRMLAGVAHEEVAVSAANLEHDGRGRRQQRSQLRPQRGAALLNVGQKLGLAEHASIGRETSRVPRPNRRLVHANFPLRHTGVTKP